MPSTLSELIEVLDLEQLEVGLYRGLQPPGGTMFQRVYGGQVAAQALVAAQRSVGPDRHVHSLHSYFILGGDPASPIVYDVENVRDGRSFTTRRVAARQHGEIIFYMTASFQGEEEGWTHQDAMPPTTSPDQVASMALLAEAEGDDAPRSFAREWSALEIAYIGDDRAPDDPDRLTHPAVQKLWFKAADRLPDERVLHNAVLAYMSDLTLLGAALMPHEVSLSGGQVRPASLDHAIWFHNRFRADEWLLYSQRSPSASGGRGMCTAEIFTADGLLVASVAQEGLIRPLS